VTCDRSVVFSWYSIQHYVIKLVSDLRQVGGFLLVLYTTLCDKVSQWLTTGRWFSPGTLILFTSVYQLSNQFYLPLYINYQPNFIYLCISTIKPMLFTFVQYQGLVLWYLTPLSAIFLLYRGGIIFVIICVVILHPQ
jgi:hypothetical protein